jgi:hypothetical protein
MGTGLNEGWQGGKVAGFGFGWIWVDLGGVVGGFGPEEERFPW